MQLVFWACAAIRVVAGYTSLEDVFGPLPVNLESGSKRNESQAKPAKYYAVRQPENCVFPLEVLIVQDSSASFEDDRAEMRSVQLREMFDTLSETHPGSKFGLVSFRDKPIHPFGGVGDYCQRVVSPLTGNSEEIYSAYDSLRASGGSDAPESQFHALIAGLEGTKVGWSNDPSATRLVVLSTDAQPHFDQDGDNDEGLPPYSGHHEPGPDEGDVEAQCLNEYYPSPSQVIRALERNSAYLALLVFDGDWQNGLVRRSWDWFNRASGQTEEFLQPLADDSSNFWRILSDAIKAIEHRECQPVSTVPPASTPPTETTPSLFAVGSTQATSPCPCPDAPRCNCPEVIIKIMNRPHELHLNFSNDP